VARDHVLQVRLSTEEHADIVKRAGPRKVSDYVRTAAVDRIAPDVAAELRGLFKVMAGGGPVGQAASQQALELVRSLCRAESE
jgi:hypothetical protein